jgi:O-antigen/teichoic acid export membrane protein
VNLRFASRLFGSPGGQRPLYATRIYEQACYGAIALLLAARLGDEAYPPIATLLIVNSAAITLSDYGLGTRILSGGASVVSIGNVRGMRSVNLVLAVAGMTAAGLLGGSWGAVCAGAGGLWFVAAESFVHKASYIKRRSFGRVALGEAAGSTVFLGLGALAAVSSSWAVALVAAGLIAKQVVEICATRVWRSVLAHDSRPGGEARRIWTGQVLTYATANVDFLIVGIFLPATSFSLYTLGYRVAAIAPSQVSYTAQRVMLVDFSRESTEAGRDGIYQTRMRQMLAVGGVATVGTIVVSPLLPALLGDSWRELPGVVAILALAVPARMVFGVGATLLTGAGRAGSLARFEAGRLVGTVLAVSLAAISGLWAVVAVSALLTMAAAAALHQLCRVSGSVRTPRSFVVTMAALGGAVVLATLWVS